ncbi:MAG: hypothetical protein FJW40_22445 [Acidobacteria bacterium]|nr:hypothetical protein [Acidobacteriota bacterium]
MIENFRDFQAGPDPFGRTWHVEYRWQQTGISIRHADTVDVKYHLRSDDDTMDKVIALNHPALLAVAAASGRHVSDAWCLKLAGLHLQHMVSTWEDMDKTLVTPSQAALEAHAATLAAAAEQAA